MLKPSQEKTYMASPQHLNDILANRMPQPPDPLGIRFIGPVLGGKIPLQRALREPHLYPTESPLPLRTVPVNPPGGPPRKSRT